MEAEPTKPFSIDQFWKEFGCESDADIMENALLGMLMYIRSVNAFDEFGKLGESYIPSIINVMLDNKQYMMDSSMNIFDYFMQLIPELAAKIPIDLLPTLYNTILLRLSQEGIRYFSHLSNVTEETIINAGNYPIDRQKAIIDILMNKLPNYIEGENTKPEMKNFSLNLFSLTIEILPFCLTNQMIKNIKDMIERITTSLSKREDNKTSAFLATTNSVATLSKVYATLINDEQQHQFFEFIENLKTPRLSAYLLSIIIEYRPQLFDLSEDKDEKYSFTYYQELIFRQLANPQTVTEFSITYTVYTIQFLKTLSVLVNKFSQKMSEEQVNQYISTVFEFLNLGSSETNEFEQNEEEEVNDLGLSDSESEDEADDGGIAETDESWKIRVAAMNLAVELINELGDSFYDSLFYIDDDNYMPKHVINLIKDEDVGCKLESLRFLRAIIRHYKNDIDPEILDDFINSLISQINRGSNEQVNIQFIKTLTFIIDDLQQAPVLELSLNAIKNINDVHKENTIDPTLDFVASLLEYSTDVEIVHPLIDLVSILLKEAKSGLLTKCLTVVSKIYHFYFKKCNNDSSLKKNLDDMNNYVISLIQLHGETVIYAITTVSVFVTCCTSLDSVQKSVDLIVSLLDNDAVAKASIGAIALISASDAAQTLSKDIKSIVEKLKKKILSEQMITTRALWTITILLQKKILKSEDCQDIVGTLFDIFNKNEGHTRLLSLKILKQIYPNGCDSTKLSLFTNILVNSPLSERAINEISELVFISSKSSFDNIKPFIDSIIEKVKSATLLGKDEAATASIISNLGLIIGIASSTNKDYCLSLVSQFKSHINEKGIQQLFALRCIGEIGSFIDLSGVDGIYKPIFDLIYDKDNKIFVPAAESIGLMSLGSTDKILKEFIKSAKDNKEYINPCLFGINSFTTQVNLIKNYISKSVFDQIVKLVPEITEFLLSNTNEEFTNTISDSLAGLIGISFDLTQKLIETATYVSIRSICVYMEKYSSYSYRPNLTEKEKEEVISLLNDMIQKYDDEQPMLNFAIVSCIKFAITKNLSKQLLENDIISICLTGTEIKQSHNIIKVIGTNQVAINIGIQLRSTSLTCIELLLKSDIADQLDYQDIANNVLMSFAMETSFELRKKSLDIIRMIANSPLQEIQEIATDTNVNENSTIDYLKSFDNVIANDNPPDEIKISYYSTLLSFISISQLAANDARKVKNLLTKHSNDPILKRVEEENQFRKVVSSNALSFTNDYTSSKLMEEFHPEAASIFFS